MESSNSEAEIEEDCVILRLPNELLLEILKYLDACDVVAFSQSCQLLSNTCHALKALNFDNTDGQSLGRSLPLLKSYLKLSVNTFLLSRCNFSGCYWIPASTLTPFLSRCAALEELYLAGTSLTIGQVGTCILPKCPKLTTLSLTLRRGDWDARLLEDSKLAESLKNLVTLELVLTRDCTTYEAVDLLKNCDNVEYVTVTRAHGSLDTLRLPYLRRRALPSRKLKSLIFISDPLMSSDCYQFFYPGSGCKLSTFWSNFLNIECPHSYTHSHTYKNLCWDLPYGSNKYSQDGRPVLPIFFPGRLHLNSQSFNHVESVWEPRPFFMTSYGSQMKLCNLFYDDEAFEEFSRTHPLIEVMKLRAFTQFVGKASRESWSSDSWSNFTKLRKLSIEPTILEEQGNQLSEIRKMGDRRKPSPEKLPFMTIVLQSCPMINELEFASFSFHNKKEAKLSMDELLAISHCVNLKKLTLSNLSITDGKFLEQILKNCTHLESLRLKDLGSADLCNYVDRLCTALPLALNLKTFVLFQKNVPSIFTLLKALESCASLSRLSLVCPSKSTVLDEEKLSAREFAAVFYRFCTKLNHMVSLFCVLNAPEAHCRVANAMLEEKLKEPRPAFCAEIMTEFQCSGSNSRWSNNPDECNPKMLPLIHSEVLTRFQSQVANLPFNHKSLLHES